MGQIYSWCKLAKLHRKQWPIYTQLWIPLLTLHWGQIWSWQHLFVSYMVLKNLPFTFNILITGKTGAAFEQCWENPQRTKAIGLKWTKVSITGFQGGEVIRAAAETEAWSTLQTYVSITMSCGGVENPYPWAMQLNQLNCWYRQHYIDERSLPLGELEYLRWWENSPVSIGSVFTKCYNRALHQCSCSPVDKSSVRALQLAFKKPAGSISEMPGAKTKLSGHRACDEMYSPH